MAKKKGYVKKPRKHGQKKNSSKSSSKRGTKKSSREKEKSKRRSRGKSSDARRNIKSKLQKGKVPISKKDKRKKNPAKGRIRDFRGQFVEGHYQDRLKKLKEDLIKSGITIDGKKVTKFTSYAKITKAIYENKLFTLAESHNVSYFDVLGKIVSETNALKPGQEIFVKIKPFFKDFRVFNIKHSEAKKDDLKKSSYYSQAVQLNPQMVTLAEHQNELIQRVIDEFPREITSPLFKIKERRFEDPLTGATYALEYDYNDIIPSGMDKWEFFEFLKAIMGDEYKRIAILRMRANLDKFSDEE